MCDGAAEPYGIGFDDYFFLLMALCVKTKHLFSILGAKFATSAAGRPQDQLPSHGDRKNPIHAQQLSTQSITQSIAFLLIYWMICNRWKLIHPKLIFQFWVDVGWFYHPLASFFFFFLGTPEIRSFNWDSQLNLQDVLVFIECGAWGHGYLPGAWERGYNAIRV